MALSAIIIGSGYGGIGAAIALQRAGVTDFTVLERSDAVGGVWRDNTYPGAACDVPSHLYSYSFAQRPDWSAVYPRQPEILDYLQGVAADFGVTRHVVTGANATRATFDEDAAAWTVETEDGRTFTADILVGATGQLSNPVTPNLPGRADFAGPQFHTAQWDHDVDLAGKRVGLIGTGASAIQVGPAVVDEVDRLVVFQRSSPWAIYRPNKEFSPRQQALMRRVPAIGRLIRLLFWWFAEWRTKVGFREDYRFAAQWSRAVERRIEKAVPDPEVRAKVIPDYRFGCKRILFSNDWYPLFARDDVDLVHGGVASVTPTGVITRDGEAIDLDVLVWATGFDTMGFLKGIEVVGRDGLTLHGAWGREPSAYLGITVPDFPNLFLVYGPNTNLGSNSIVAMIEQQMAHLQGAVEHLHRTRAATLEVRPEVATRFRDEMHERQRDLVWGSCESWYLNDEGYSPTNWPGTVGEYRRRTATFDPADYVVGSTTTASPVAI